MLEFLEITPVSLAEKMGVQRTSFNHLLSGRNKPGFEFLTRLHACYPSINLNWLISGYGPMIDEDDSRFSYGEKNGLETHTDIDLFSNIFANANITKAAVEELKEVPAQAKKEEKVAETHPDQEEVASSIDRLIIIYKNGKIVEIKQ